MKAKLEPRIVAAKIHVLAPAVHGVPEPPEEIMASSQGGLMDAMDAVSYEFGSKDPETAPPWSLEIADFNLSFAILHVPFFPANASNTFSG